MDTLCRLCMNFGSVGMEPIFRSMMDSCFAKKIASVTQLTLFEGDGLPANLCQQCIFKLDVADTFIQKCTLSDRALRAMLTVQNEFSAPSGDSESGNSWQRTSSQSLFPMSSNAHRANNIIRFGSSKKLQKDKNEDLAKATIDFIKLEDSGEDETIEYTSPLKQSNGNLTAKDAINCMSEQMEYLPEIDCSSLNTSMEKEVGNLTPHSQASKFEEKHLSEKNHTGHIKRHLSKKPRRNLKAAKAQRERQAIPEKSSATITEASGNPKFSCGICDRSFNSQMDLENHSLGHLRKRPLFPCDLCPKKFARIDILNEHKERHGRRRGTGHFECDICLKTCRLKKSLTEHILGHLVERPFNCAVCDKNFRTTITLNAHMLLHVDKKPYKCTKCNMGFAQSNKLTSHMVVHSNRRPYICSTCNHGFKRAYNLKAHMSRGCNKQDHKCTLCNKMFATTDSLEAHILVHSTEQGHSCFNCGKKFARAAMLKAHMLTLDCNKQPQKLHTKCTKCDKRFERMDKLRNHMLVHSKIYHHKCTLCDKSFKAQWYLQRHMKVHVGHTLDLQSKSSKDTDNMSALGYVCAVYGSTSGESRMPCLADSPVPDGLDSITPSLTTSAELDSLKIFKQSLNTSYKSDGHKSLTPAVSAPLEPNDQHSPTPSPGNSSMPDGLDNFTPSFEASHEPSSLDSFLPNIATSYESDDLEVLTPAITASQEPNDGDIPSPSYKTSFENDSDSLVFVENLSPCKDSEKSLSECFDLESLLPSHEVIRKNSYVCKLCGQTFSELVKLESHIPSHQKVIENLFPCEVCGNKFNMLIDLESHMKSHPELFPCKVCGKVFNTKESVSYHMIIHVRPPSHKCPKCTRCFLTTLGLKEHMKIHEEDC